MSSLASAAIAGVNITDQGDLSERTQSAVWWEAVRGACDDAGLSITDIDGIIGEGPQGIPGLRDTMPAAGLAEQLGRPIRFHARSSVGAASTASGLNLAAYAIAHGLAEVIVIANAVAGRSGGYASADRDVAVAHMSKLSGPYEYVYGTTRVSDYAILAMRHMHEYGTTSEQLAAIAVSQRYGATLHPLSVHGHQGELSVGDVLSSRMVSDPLHLLDCCLINQGGGAIIVTRESDVAASSRHTPVVLLGYGEGHSHIDVNAVASMTTFPAAKSAADTAFGMAGLSRDEIDVAGVGDHFTIGVLIGLEDAGFCSKGEGGPFAEKGGTAIGGRLPTNTSGGFLSFSHSGQCGIYSLIEVVEQLRHEAGPRQVEGARHGFICGVGGVQQAHSALVLGRT
jgi:acetyl-CoA acetyltransferase